MTGAIVAARAQLLRRVAHDIASPTGVTVTVLDELSTSDHPRPELIAMARRSLRRLMRLSEQLAVAAELEAGGLTPDAAPNDMRALVRQAVDDALAIDGRKDVVAACDLPSAALLVCVDARLIVAVIREIVGNALRIASSRVEIALTRVDDGSMAIRVDDDGSGFSADALARLQGKPSGATPPRGLGLSLAIATDILAAHSGSLRVEPSLLPPGRKGVTGAAVVVELPAYENVVGD